MSTASAADLAIVGRASAGRPRTLRQERPAASRQAAYRRLASVILRLDVATLGSELGTARVKLSLPHAA